MVTTFTYPQSDYDNPAALLELLGSFWANTYPDQLVEDLVVAYALVARQTHEEMLDLLNACGRRVVPVLHRPHWYQLVLKESEHNTEPGTSMSVYGSGIYYGPQPVGGEQLKYGEPWFPYSVFPAPDGLVDCTYIFNRITQPSLSLIRGPDFLIDTDNQVVVFKDNPFENSNVAAREVYVDGQVTDREVSLWMFRPGFDRSDIYTQFGYPLRFELDSTESYRNAVNALWDGLIKGTGSQDVQETIAAICDVPLVQGTETVEVIQDEGTHLSIVTDQRAYRFNANATAIVSVGDTVRPGDQLTNAVRIYEFGHGAVPADLQAITLGPGFLPEGYYDGLTFHNKDVDLVVDTTGVFTKVSFEIGGWPGDIEKFWDDFHDKGVAAGQTLAQLLDQRVNKVGEPGASNLPATVNPLEFLAENVLRNNAFIVKIGYNRLGPDAVSIQHLRQLRRLIPPHTGLIILAELDAEDDTVTLTESTTETAESYSAGEPMLESVDITSYVAETATLQHVGAHCI
jgi:hypothetical protein